MITTVMLDKTGTLTLGRPILTDVIAFDPFSRDEVMSLAAAAERNSEHPLAQSLVKSVNERGLTVSTPDSFQALPGLGVKAVVEGRAIIIGNSALMQDSEVATETADIAAEKLWNEGKTVLFLSIDKHVSALFALSDTLKPDVAAAVSKMKKMGLRVVMLTGDNRSAADYISVQA